ncbi:ParB family protein [Hydrogenophaga atypica]|uniref:ParB family protein n=1 Tax=Hydrogenophaga atypica TaxID=249409 RepID=A0ABW2QR29_9BURK
MNKTPESVTAAQRAQRLGITLVEADTSTPSLSDAKDTAIVKPNKQLQHQNMARENMMRGLSLETPRNAKPAIDPRADKDMSFSLLPIDDIEPYEHNPRTGLNPRYDEIKASIRAEGITNTLTVTRRPQSQKYMPYGGGNTRLRIAKELYHEEGDQRFAQLHVIVRAWPGDANTISAHLAENEMRGDISFWEKAHGVDLFRQEFQREHGRVLTAGDLNKELRERGINFGIKTIQNFLFAVEHLKPVGSWLKSTDVNEIIRPCMGGLLDLAKALDTVPAVEQAMAKVLNERANELLLLVTQNTELPENERHTLNLDVDNLVKRLNLAAAQALNCDPAVIPLMVTALANDSRISADSLRRIKVVQAPAPAPESVSPQESDPAANQLPLAGMLAGVPGRAAPTPSLAAAPQPTSSPPAGRAPVASGGAQANAPVVPGPSLDSAPANPLANVHQLLQELDAEVPIRDAIMSAPYMPFGFLVEFPTDLYSIEGQPLDEALAGLRAGMLKFLIGVSGQLNTPYMVKHTNAQASSWMAAVLSGISGFAETYRTRLVGDMPDGGQPCLALSELTQILNSPGLSYLVPKLLLAMEQVRVNHPERMDAFKPQA